ncbi:MAG: hypothetical protein ILA15_03945 [Clostridiales bacterium]|nr:hypothetical protein [Clostridiales bacterium]
MFEEFNAKYEDFCWYEITNELSKNNIEKQTKQEIWPSSPLYAIIDKLEAVAKSERQDDVLFFDGSKYYVIHLAWNKGNGCGPRYKVLLPNELSEYLEWYQLNV